MRERRIWPNGRRYLWTGAFGVVLLVSLYRRLGENLNAFFAEYRSGDEYDTDAITHVMGCASLLPGDFILKKAEAA